MTTSEAIMDTRDSGDDVRPEDMPDPRGKLTWKQRWKKWRELAFMWFYPTVAYMVVMGAFLSLAPASPIARIRLVLIGLMVFWTVMWASFAFSGDPYRRRTHALSFAYYFVLLSFAVFSLPTLVLGNAIGGEPLGIISGCVQDPRAAEQVRCLNPAIVIQQPAAPESAAAAAPAPAQGLQLSRAAVRNQWLVNVGGTIKPQVSCDPAVDAANRKLRLDEACTPGSPGNRVFVSGGVVVPLSFVIIALVGGAISLSRQVPEIQRLSETYDYESPPSGRSAGRYIVPRVVNPVLSAADVRQKLVFLIVQFISAPLLAAIAYQVIEPESAATSAALAFMCGFGSQAVLEWVRTIGESIGRRKTGQAGARESATATGAATGVIYGVVKAAGQPQAYVRIQVDNSAAATRSDADGLFFLKDVLAGDRLLIVEGCDWPAAVHVTAGAAIQCSIDVEALREEGAARAGSLAA